MTTTEKERLAVVEDKLSRTNEDIREIKSDVKEVLNRFDQLPDQFLTRREAAVLRTVIGILVASIASLASVMLVVKK